MVWSRRVGLSQICLQNTALECFSYNNEGDITLVVITETVELYLSTMLADGTCNLGQTCKT